MIDNENSIVSIPTVHLNGTSKSELKEQIREAYAAVIEARRALRVMSPHGRDYYVQSNPDAYRVARDQQSERVKALLSVEDALVAIFNGIDSQEGN